MDRVVLSGFSLGLQWGGGGGGGGGGVCTIWVNCSSFWISARTPFGSLPKSSQSSYKLASNPGSPFQILSRSFGENPPIFLQSCDTKTGVEPWFKAGYKPGFPLNISIEVRILSVVLWLCIVISPVNPGVTVTKAT